MSRRAWAWPWCWPGSRGAACRSWTPRWSAATASLRPDPDPQGRCLVGPGSQRRGPAGRPGRRRPAVRRRRPGLGSACPALAGQRCTWPWATSNGPTGTTPGSRPCGPNAVSSGVRVRAAGTRTGCTRPWRPAHRAGPPRPCPEPVWTGWESSRPTCSSASARCCSRPAWPAMPWARSTRRWPRIEQEHGSATRRAELLYSSALAAVATGRLRPGAGAQRRSPAAVPPPAAPVVGGAGRAHPAAVPVRGGQGSGGRAAARGPAGDRPAGRDGSMRGRSTPTC